MLHAPEGEPWAGGGSSAETEAVVGLPDGDDAGNLRDLLVRVCPELDLWRVDDCDLIPLGALATKAGLLRRKVREAAPLLLGAPGMAAPSLAVGSPIASPPRSRADPDPMEVDAFSLAELVEVVVRGDRRRTHTPGSRRQYINLDGSIDPRGDEPAVGRVVSLRARVQRTSGSASLSSRVVRWRALPGGENSTSLEASERAGFDGPGGSLEKSSSTDAAGWTAPVPFHLSSYGGDVFTLEAEELSSGTAITAGSYTVWRRLWFEVDTMKKRGGGHLEMDHARLPALLEPCFIDLEQQGDDNRPANVWNLETPELHDFANQYFGAERSPFQFHEIAIDHQADRKTVNLTVTMSSPVFLTGTADSYFTYEAPSGWLLGAEYRVVGSRLGWIPLDPARVSLVGPSSVYKQVRVDLTSGPVIPRAGAPVEVRLKLLQSQEWSGDGGSSPHAVIAMGYWYDTETSGEARRRTVGTMAHELGHLLGMVPRSSLTFVDTGTGPHCSDPVCVMSSTNTPTRGNSFCRSCTEELRRADLSSTTAAFRHSRGPRT